MATYTLQIITSTDLKTSTIMRLPTPAPFITGTGPDNYLCGSCGNVLLKNVHPGQFRSIIIGCGKCKAYNALP